MRFAYIDSQGNEVSIPSVDALALRIELGAVGPDTELYDAQADRWGPASSHEIFNTLVREAEEEGFVAPPPPVSAPPPMGGEAPSEPSVEEDEATAAAAGDAPARFDLSEDLGEAAPSEPLAPVDEPAAPAEPSGDLGLDFTLAEGLDAAASEAEPEPAPAAAEPEETGGVDFGDLGGLELEASFDEEDAEDAEAAADLAGGMQLEEPLADQMDFSAPAEGGLDLETPMSEFTPDAPPAWMEQDGPAGAVEPDDGSMSFDAPALDETPPPAATPAAGEDEERPERVRREPRTRPSPPRRKPQRSFAGLAIGVVVLAAVGAGAWFGWNALRSGGGADVADQAPALPPVAIPDIPAELLPTMRDLGETALAATIAELSALREAFGLVPEPRDDWLAGIYLANASQFGDVEEFWRGISAFVDSVRSVDTRVFHDQYVLALEEAGIEGDTAAMLLERADSGFLATRQDRFEAYNQMSDLVVAALNLHEFLLLNEDAIEYTPAAGGMSRDPVLEAVPATEDLGDQMWAMVDEITGALDVLGTLDRVTTERLLAVLFDRIRRAGFE